MIDLVDVRDWLAEALRGLDEAGGGFATVRDRVSKAFVAVALEVERVKVEAMTPEQKVAYYREIVSAQLAAAKPYVGGERQARPVRKLVVTGNMPLSIEARVGEFVSYDNSRATGVRADGSEVVFRRPSVAALAGLAWDDYVLEYAENNGEIAHWLATAHRGRA